MALNSSWQLLLRSSEWSLKGRGGSWKKAATTIGVKSIGNVMKDRKTVENCLPEFETSKATVVLGQKCLVGFMAHKKNELRGSSGETYLGLQQVAEFQGCRVRGRKGSYKQAAIGLWDWKIEMADRKDSENSPLWPLGITGRHCMWGSKLTQSSGDRLERRLRELTGKSSAEFTPRVKVPRAGHFHRNTCFGLLLFVLLLVSRTRTF